MRTPFSKSLFCLLATLSVLSCEKPIVGVEDETRKGDPTTGDKVHITFTLSSPNNYGFVGEGTATRAKKNVSEVCTRINYAFYKDGDVYLTASQTDENANFGTISADFDEGTYNVLFIAHNGLGNATLTDPEKVTFKDNKVTDTFYYYGEITISDEQNYDITLKRAVAMFRLVVNDNTPSTVKQMKFYYTGGSSTFDATSGYGCVNSKQTELRDVEDASYSSSSKYEVYTFPHSDGKNLKIKVSALSSSGGTEYEKTFENVPVAINEITQYYGNFFKESSSGGRINVYVDDEWTQNDYSY